MNELTNRVALVTGGSRGIGAAIVRRLAAQGADLVLTYERAEERAAAVADEVRRSGRRCLAVRADGGDEAAVTAAVDGAVDHFGRLDIVVNNAATFPVGPLTDLGAAALDRALAVNVRAPYLVSRAAARHLGDGGRIISIGSNIAERVPFGGMTLYALTKTALVGMTKGLARELGPRGITVNLVHPGPTDTDANPADGPNAETIAALTTLGRYAVPDEIAAVVSFLAGADGRYVTGAVVNADGGFAV